MRSFVISSSLLSTAQRRAVQPIESVASVVTPVWRHRLTSWRFLSLAARRSTCGRVPFRRSIATPLLINNLAMSCRSWTCASHRATGRGSSAGHSAPTRNPVSSSILTTPSWPLRTARQRAGSPFRSFSWANPVSTTSHDMTASSSPDAAAIQMPPLWMVSICRFRLSTRPTTAWQ